MNRRKLTKFSIRKRRVEILLQPFVESIKTSLQAPKPRNRGLKYGRERNILFPKASRRTLEPNQLTTEWLCGGVYFPRGKTVRV